MEEMKSFFALRVADYDEHMLNEVEGCREGYSKMAEMLPVSTKRLLDLGCGTGLELDEIFKTAPELFVTAIDLTPEMLEALLKKHPSRNLETVCGDYFKVDFGVLLYDAAISFETMHHFEKDDKLKLYKRIYDALKPNGCYIECDYMVETQSEEDKYFEEYRKLKEELRVNDGTYYHFDTPCTVENQIELLEKAGFSDVKKVFKKGGTVMIVAKK